MNASEAVQLEVNGQMYTVTPSIKGRLAGDGLPKWPACFRLSSPERDRCNGAHRVGSAESVQVVDVVPKPFNIVEAARRGAGRCRRFALQ